MIVLVVLSRCCRASFWRCDIWLPSGLRGEEQAITTVDGSFLGSVHEPGGRRITEAGRNGGVPCMGGRMAGCLVAGFSDWTGPQLLILPPAGSGSPLSSARLLHADPSGERQVTAALVVLVLVVDAAISGDFRSRYGYATATLSRHSTDELAAFLPDPEPPRPGSCLSRTRQEEYQPSR